jgi:hypothetical protein
VSSPKRRTFSRWVTLGVTAPPPGSARVVQMRFVRDLQLRTLVVSAGIVAVAAITTPPWVTLACAAALACGLLNLGWLEIRIRRESEREPSAAND